MEKNVATLSQRLPRALPKFCLARPEILQFHLRPFVAEQDCDPGAELFRDLELFSDFRRRQGIIDAITSIAQRLNVRERIRAALFLRDDDVDIQVLLRGDCGLQLLASAAGISPISSARTTSPMAKPMAGNETAPSLS